MDGRLILVLILALQQIYHCNAEATTKALEVLAHNMKTLQDVVNEKLGHLSDLEKRVSYTEKKLSYIMNTENAILDRIKIAEKRLFLVQTDEYKTQRRVDMLERRLMLLQKSEYSLLKRIQRIDKKKDGLKNNEANEKENDLRKLLIKAAKFPDSAVHTEARRQVIDYTDESPQAITENLTTSEMRTKKRITNPGIRQNPSLDRHKVAFIATLHKSILSFSLNQTILFDTIVYNEGNSFDIRTGTFTCPFGGTYYFSATAVSIVGHRMDLVLVKEGVMLVNLLTSNTQSTTGAVTRCEAGQKIWLRVRNGSHLYGDSHTSLSGFILWGDETGSS